LALEQVLLGLYGEHKLYRSGMTIRTTLDGRVQDELNREEDKTAWTEAPERITIVRQGEQIRGMLCSPGKEAAVRERLSAAGYPATDYEVMSMGVDDVTREQISPAANEANKPESSQNSILGRSRN
jgi:membrane carboxypeptidase/penicillin-binding protein